MCRCLYNCHADNMTVLNYYQTFWVEILNSLVVASYRFQSLNTDAEYKK